MWPPPTIVMLIFLVHKTGTHRTNYQISNTLMLGFWWRVWSRLAPRHFLWQAWRLVTLMSLLWQAWHLLTSTSLLILFGKRVTYGIFWRWAGTGAGVFCVADIDGHFARQAWHSVASTFTLSGRLLILALTLCGRSDNRYGNGSGGALGRIWRCGTLSGS